MEPPGARRERLSAALTRAYADGLLSQRTFAHRIDTVVRATLLAPESLIGDLSVRAARPGPMSRARAWLADRRTGRARADSVPAVLALDWTGATDCLLLGRAPSCDVVLGDPTVSRAHAQLRFRDGSWVLRDLRSRNGTTVNRVPVDRCRLQPGDRLSLGRERLIVD